MWKAKAVIFIVKLKWFPASCNPRKSGIPGTEKIP